MRLLTWCLVGAFVIPLGGCSGESAGERAAAQLEALQKKKALDAQTKQSARNKPIEKVKLDPPYDDTQAISLMPDAPCPEGFWALFTGDVPGVNPEERKTNAANRAAIAEKVRSKKYVVRLRGPPDVQLEPWDPQTQKFLVHVSGSVDCTDSLGTITMAWTDAAVIVPKNSAAQEGSTLRPNVWQAKPVQFSIPMKNPDEAAKYYDQTRFALTARVGMTLGQVMVDKKLKKIAAAIDQSSGEKVGFGGDVEDWGAGRLIRAEMLGTRVAVQGERKQLFEMRPGQPATVAAP